MVYFHDHHDHTISIGAFDLWSCEMCDQDLNLEELDFTYRCKECPFILHKKCVDHYFTKPFLCNHLLKISADANANERCYFCQHTIQEMSSTIARCTICNISMHLGCIARQPPLTIFQPKHHKHSLTLLLRLVTFTCNACGVEGDRNPYVCLQCNLMLHKDCIDLPRVISINRHDHRISHTFHLGQGEGDWKCGVCRKTIDWVYGAFKCSRCPSYAVHSRCATRKEVWDGIELEDVPEEEEEIEDPFKVLNETDIVHFSHEQHILRLDENYVLENDNRRCRGCFSPLYDNPCYKCVECDFCLHKACANLPRKKRHLLHNHKLTLEVDDGHKLTLEVDGDDAVPMIRCTACSQLSSKGFRYTCSQEYSCKNDCISYDVRCSSVSEPFNYDLHPHPLYFTLEGSKRCHACLTEIDDNPLSCMDCEYALCMKCATLPRKVKHRCDDHFLSLRQGAGNSSGDLWCDICETKTDPSVRYYTCAECGLSLHINCVLGDFYYLKVGSMSRGLEVLANNSVTRPFCSGCKAHCKFPVVLRITTEESVRGICSGECSASISCNNVL